MAFEPLVDGARIQVFEVGRLLRQGRALKFVEKARALGARDAVPEARAEQILPGHAEQLRRSCATKSIAPIAVEDDESVGDALERGREPLRRVMQCALRMLALRDVVDGAQDARGLAGQFFEQRPRDVDPDDRGVLAHVPLLDLEERLLLTLDGLRRREGLRPILGMREVEPRHATGEFRGAVADEIAIAPIGANDAIRRCIDFAIRDGRRLEQATKIRFAGAQGFENPGISRDALTQRRVFALQSF